MEEQEIEVETEKLERRKRKKSPFVFLVGMAVVALAAILMINASKYQSTEDAFIETHTVQVAPKVSGQVVDVYVNDNQHVNEGDLVAQIDDIDYKVKLAEVNARYELVLNKQKNARANLSAVDSEINLAKINLDRYTKLFKAGAASKQELDVAQTKYDAVKSSLTQANENMFSKSNNNVADAELKQLAALKKQAELNLSYTKIYAAQPGSVTRKNVERGSYVQVGQPLFAIVPDDIWVIANFKESQLTNMKVGQEVEIKVDAYPQKLFKGKIDSIQRSSGAKSSLFPPENAVGSFVKIVQRIPVKIVFTEKIDKDKYTIVPGMSVEPKIKVLD